MRFKVYKTNKMSIMMNFYNGLLLAGSGILVNQTMVVPTPFGDDSCLYCYILVFELENDLRGHASAHTVVDQASYRV